MSAGVFFCFSIFLIGIKHLHNGIVFHLVFSMAAVVKKLPKMRNFLFASKTGLLLTYAGNHVRLKIAFPVGFVYVKKESQRGRTNENCGDI